MRAPLFFLPIIAGLSLVVAGCSRQAMAYHQSPICKQSRQKWEAYEKARKQLNGDKRDVLKWQREEYEATARACAESVQYLQQNSAPTSNEEWQHPDVPRH